MAQPLDKAHFEALMAQAGLDLTEAEKDGIRAASAHTQAAAARVRIMRGFKKMFQAHNSAAPSSATFQPIDNVGNTMLATAAAP